MSFLLLFVMNNDYNNDSINTNLTDEYVFEYKLCCAK